MSIATTPRSYNRTTNQWEDGKTVYTRASAWDEMAENIAASLTKGSRIIAVGVLKAGSYRNKDGVEVDTTELQIDEIGHTLRHHTLTAQKRGKNVPQGPAATQSSDWAQPAGVDETPW